MSLRVVKDRLRPESPRLKDTPAATARDPSVGRSADGRFATGNGAANGRAAKALIRESLGSEGAEPEVVRQALTMYRALLRDLPSDGPSVRQLVAARCRHAVMATRYANEAAKAGLATPAGIKLAEQSRAHDLAAQRLAVTSYDLAVRGAALEGDRRAVDRLPPGFENVEDA
ncbi:MAG TPA: hypothetical protein VGG39_24920 [Polyangiaceae bacterium]